MRKAAAGSPALAAALALAACGGAPDPTKGARIVNVVAAENVWGDVAAQIGGRHAKVTSIISDPNADPHLFASDPRTAARLGQANLAIVNGLGYDDFARKLLAAGSGAKRRVLTIADVLRPPGPDPNPHLWYDAPQLPAVARAIATELAREDPRDTALFRAGAARFERSLKPLDAAIAAIRARHRGAPVAYTERVPGYLIAAAGLSVRTPPGYARAIEQGSEPAPGDVQRMNDLVNGRRIRVLLYNAQATSTATQRLRSLARSAGIAVVPVTETLPAGMTFQAWQIGQANALLNALGGP